MFSMASDLALVWSVSFYHDIPNIDLHLLVSRWVGIALVPVFFLCFDPP